MQVVKTCKVHGDLTIDRVYRCIEKGKIKFRCAQCRRETATRSADKYRERTRAYSVKYRAENPERRRKIGREFRRKYADELHDIYIKDRLNRTDGLKAHEVTPEMIEIKRVIIKIGRMKKQKNATP